MDNCNLEFWVNYNDGYGAWVYWSSNTAGRGNNCRAELQTDRNFVVYDELNRVIWASDTYQYSGIYDPNVRIQVQNDVNVVMYANATYCGTSGWWALWSPNTGSTKPWNHCSTSCNFMCVPDTNGFACGC
jgi:hypothetical protein